MQVKSVKRWALAVVTVGLLLTGVRVLWPRAPTVVLVSGRVVEHRWDRRVSIERFDDWWGDGRCTAVPSGARVISWAKLKTGTQRQGNRNVDVYEEMCTWKVISWKPARDLSARARDSAPDWPRLTVDSCDGGEVLGCEREGPRDEALSVLVQTEDGGVVSCTLELARWKSMLDGARVSMPVTVHSSGWQSPDCSQLTFVASDGSE